MKHFSKISMKYFFIIIIALGTFLIIYYINVSKTQYITLSQKMLKQEAIAHYENMVNTRIWNSQHGGVYIKAKDGAKPNPYLVDNHTFTIDNELLIKVNPAWMTRQISEISNKNSDYFYRITSENPINPINKTDDFEKEGFEFFEKNQNELYYTKLTENNFNFLGALKVKKSCLQCHSSESYEIGASRGGFRVSIPLKDYNKNIKNVKSNSYLLSFIIVLIATFILLVVFYFINTIFNRQKKIEELNTNLESKIKLRTKELELNVKKLKEIATIDFLTKIPNRRYFFDLGSKLFSLSKRDNTELSLIIVDIDFFKKVNDTYGHNIGDEILKLVAKHMQENIRTSDILARIGGEEFAIILNETSSSGAFIIAEKLRKLIEKVSYPYNDERVSVTISMGISSLNTSIDTKLKDILLRSDNALYISKASGRNKVSIE